MMHLFFSDCKKWQKIWKSTILHLFHKRAYITINAAAHNNELRTSAHIINECNAGATAGFDNKEKIKEIIKDYYNRFITTGLPDNTTASIEKYSRKALAKEYSKLLEGLSQNHHDNG